jgi:RNA polymerase-binding transcription factor DksA
MADKKDEVQLKFPDRLLKPIKRFLESEIVRLKRTEKGIKTGDPFSDRSRTLENSTQEDSDEQVGHFEAEVKIGFVTKQIVQLRRALTMMKIGKYGICERCGKMINTDRLAINPGVTICIKCEKERES